MVAGDHSRINDSQRRMDQLDAFQGPGFTPPLTRSKPDRGMGGFRPPEQRGHTDVPLGSPQFAPEG